MLYAICYILYTIYYKLCATYYMPVLHLVCYRSRTSPATSSSRGWTSSRCTRGRGRCCCYEYTYIYIYITFHCLSSFVGITICPSNIKSSSRCTQGRAVRSCPRSRSRRQRSTTGGGGKRRATKTHAI